MTSIILLAVLSLTVSAAQVSSVDLKSLDRSFAEAFSCKADDAMVSPEPCRVW